MNTALLTFATAAFMALSAPAHQRDANSRKGNHDKGSSFKSEKVIAPTEHNDQACDSTSYKIPANSDLTVQEGSNY